MSLQNYHNKISNWLFLCCLMVIAMTAIGGLTRLAEAGLSMTQWQPILGILPPLDYLDWITAFYKYQQIAQFQELNPGMTLAEFKFIFYIEYFHRLFGRITGLVFIIPLLYFLFKKVISPILIVKLCFILLLGILQALAGWYMVSSGLFGSDLVYVSQYRLTLHLIFAFIIYALLFWFALEEKFTHLRLRYSGIRSFNSPLLSSFGIFIMSGLFIQIFFGGFVAGTHAGLAYNTFPLMDGDFIPNGLFTLEPWYKNIFENITTIQFNHRIFAYFLAILVLIFWFIIFSSQKHMPLDLVLANHAFLLLFILQFVLGVATLLSNVSITLASLHQINSMLLLSCILYINYRFNHKRGSSF